MRKNPRYLRTTRFVSSMPTAGRSIPRRSTGSAKAPNLMFRQDPGRINAMASTKINFHNDHAVYLHDTPQQDCSTSSRASTRRMRAGPERPRSRDLAAARDAGWSRRQIERVIKSGVNTPVRLSREVPVYFKYVTAWSATNGVVQFRDDIYHMDGISALALETASTGAGHGRN